MTLLRVRNMVPFSPSSCLGKPESGYLTSQDTEGIGHMTAEELQSLVVAGPKLNLTPESDLTSESDIQRGGSLKSILCVQ